MKNEVHRNEMPKVRKKKKTEKNSELEAELLDFLVPVFSPHYIRIFSVLYKCVYADGEKIPRGETKARVGSLYSLG